MAEKIKILLIEDDKVDQMAFERSIERNGWLYDYTIASSVQEAKMALSAEQFDIALIDYALGDGTAFDLFGDLGETPFIIVTGSGDERVAVEAMKAGAFDYLVKDLLGNYLIVLPVTVENAIRRKRTEDELERHREHLEELVKERTAELARANEQLLTEIAEHKRAEEQIEAALAERDVLLREIHHRVKNNLQVVSALLDFQVEASPDPSIQQAFLESQNRISSMARIHEQLYLAGDLVGVEMESYLYELVANLAQSYAAQRLTFEIKADGVAMSVEQAMPCGLLVNELVSNALKHAFPAGRAGRLRVALLSVAGGLELTVHDSGVGLPAGLDIKTSDSLGLRLIEMFSRQLKGTLTVDSGQERGTTFRVTFPTRR